MKICRIGRIIKIKTVSNFFYRKYKKKIEIKKIGRTTKVKKKKKIIIVKLILTFKLINLGT